MWPGLAPCAFVMQGKSHSVEKQPMPPKRKGGRPPAEHAGDVDRRILDAARRQFLAQGFDATSCEQVAAEAGAGKASLYTRYANKEALFTAVVRRNVETIMAHPIDPVPSGLPARERLQILGNAILVHALQPDVVALMRVVIATAHRLPELAQLNDSIGRDRGVLLSANALCCAQATSQFLIDHALPTAAKFIDIAFVPFQMGAL